MKKPAPRNKPVKGTWRPPSLARLWTIQIQLQEEIKDLQAKVSALQHPVMTATEAVMREAMDMRSTVNSNQVAEILTKSESSMEIVRKRVCHINGHRIGILERQVPNQELPDPSKAFHRTTVVKQEVICLACGMTLEEIRTAK